MITAVRYEAPPRYDTDFPSVDAGWRYLIVDSATGEKLDEVRGYQRFACAEAALDSAIRFWRLQGRDARGIVTGSETLIPEQSTTSTVTGAETLAGAK